LCQAISAKMVKKRTHTCRILAIWAKLSPEYCRNRATMKTHNIADECPLLAVTGRSGTGKTTLLTALLPRLRAAGLRVGAVKQARADFEVDRQGKDRWRLRKAGAAATIVASGRRWAMMVEEPEDGGRPDLRRLLAQLHAERLDLVLLEGFAHEPVPRIDVRRHPVGAPPPASEDAWLVAVATDRPAELVASVPVLDLDDACEIEGFVLEWLRTDRLRP
jgi:molybdopterin-guanine dinucleotide biosynthesis adapter protein